MSNPSNNNPPDPNDPATFTGNSGVAATPAVPAAPASAGANTGATGHFGGWYIWTTAPNYTITAPSLPTPNTQWIISGSTDPTPAEPKATEPVRQQKVKRGNEEGYDCQGCKVFNAYADLNEPEGSSDPTHYRCYSCRKGING